jgi:hypothetical protein
MADPKEIFREELGIVKFEIQSEQQALGITDSGLSANSIVIKGSRAQGAVLTAVGYLQTNFDGIGRGPGGFPPVQDIMRWGKLAPRAGQTLEQAAFLVARKIAEQGTDIHTGRRRGIDMDEIQKRSADRLAESLADNELIRFNDIFE